MRAPSDMTDSELDAAVAVEVMGLCPCGDPRLFAKGSGLPGSPAPRYSTNIAADYEVLVHVRETWCLREQNVFYDLLDHTWAVRTENRHRYVPENVGEYRPGDYARAALAAVRGRR